MDTNNQTIRPFSTTHYKSKIKKHFPDLRTAVVRPITQEGQYNDALLVDDSLIFRFPRYQEGIEMMRREVAFLRAIRGQTTLPIPDPVYAHLDNDELGQVFMGYPLLPGEALWRPAVFAQSDDQVLDRWARQLAGFLRELHAISSAVLPTDWPAVDTREEWETMYVKIQTHLFPLMRPDARQEVRDHYEAYLDDPTLHAFSPTLRHGDFGSGNILYDPQTMAITGIIDFGFADLGDPAIDIAAVSTLGEALFGRFPDYYANLDALLPRARFYRGTYALAEALHGFKSGDQEALTAGLAQYV